MRGGVGWIYGEGGLTVSGFAKLRVSCLSPLKICTANVSGTLGLAATTGTDCWTTMGGGASTGRCSGVRDRFPLLTEVTGLATGAERNWANTSADLAPSVLIESGCNEKTREEPPLPGLLG